MKKLFTFFLLSLLVLSGCAAATPASTAEVVTVQYTAATQPWLAGLVGCAGENIVSAEIRSADTLDIQAAEISMRIGETANLLIHTYQIGTDALRVIANRQNPVTQLSIEQVRGLFGGQIKNWKDVKGSDAPVQVWVFATGEDVEQVFEQTGLGDSPVTSTARLATSPGEMAQAIANDVNAIGILTRHWQAEGVADLFTVASVPVLAILPAEPQGVLRQVIDCLQK